MDGSIKLALGPLVLVGEGLSDNSGIIDCLLFFLDEHFTTQKQMVL